jgi:hypothetical protein
MNGPIGGVQAGYNWQNGNYLLALKRISKVLAKALRGISLSALTTAPALAALRKEPRGFP